MYFSTLLAFAALLSLVGAVPVSPSQSSSRAKGPRSFPLSKHANHLNRDGLADTRKMQAAIRQTEAKYHRAFDAYEKRTGETHPLVSKRTHSNEPRFSSTSFNFSTNFTETYTNTSDLVWTLPATIGTPGVSFSMKMDTFSPDTFVGGVNCQTCSGHNPYDFTLSSTAKDMHSHATLENLNGPVIGEVVSDTISIGSANANVEFVVATYIDPIYQSPFFLGDGCIGLGLKQQSTLNVDSWFTDSSVPSGEEEVFGLALSPTGTGPQFIYGGTDNSKIAGSLTYIKLTKKARFWEIAMDSVTVNGNVMKTTNTYVVIDSGSTFIFGSKEDIVNLHKNIPGAAPDPTNLNQFTVPCNTSVDVVYKFGGKDFTIAPDNYVISPADYRPGVCVSGFVVTNDDASKLNAWIFGGIFLESVYAEFDEKNWRIGLGKPAY